jgi:tetratricopeptide (TPR) repeat protein
MSIPESPSPVKVFVSSVYKELVAYRQVVLDAIWRCDMYPVGMEREDIALPYSTLESSLRMAQDSQVYIGIFSHRYSDLTVQEYHWAVDHHLPILIFLADAPLNADDREDDPAKQALLDALKTEARATHVVAHFSTIEELRFKALASLMRLKENRFHASPHSPSHIAADIPVAPAPYDAHPYFLGHHFFGRQAEVRQLDDWARSSSPMMVIDAIGGAGKSALAWHWLHQHADAILPTLEGRMWWSFYESEGTMGKFLPKFLAYATGEPLKSFTEMPRFEQEQRALAVLEQKQILLVLDGVERLLQAYHRHDAAQMKDETARADDRACTDARDGAFLRILTLSRTAKVLLTSRLVPKDVMDRLTGQLLPGVRVMPLHGLTREDALAMLQGSGVRGTPALMQAMLDQFGEHALLIGVIAGRIREYRAAPGDFDAWYAAEGATLQLRDQDMVAKRQSILAAALDALASDHLRLLAQMAAFRYPIDYAALLAINPFAPPAGPAPDAAAIQAGFGRLNTALADLEARDLIQWDRPHNRYDMHPVVRAYAYERLEDQAGTYGRIRDYFQAQPEEDVHAVQDVTDLRRTLEIYHALIGGGQFDQARDLYRDRLKDPLREVLGAYPMMVETLLPLFPHGIQQPPALSTLQSRIWTINELAVAFKNLGDSGSAIALYTQVLQFTLQERNARDASVILNNIGLALRDLTNAIVTAIHAYELALRLAQAAADQHSIDSAHFHVIRAYVLVGDFANAHAAYQALLDSPNDAVKQQAIASIWAGWLAYLEGENPWRYIEEGLKRAKQQQFLIAERFARILEGEVALTQDDLSRAEAAWQAALEIAQKEGIPLWPHQADMARLRARQGQAEEARHWLDLAFASGSPDLAAAEVYLALGEETLARQHILPAYTWAWADGPPYTLVYDLKRARAVLAALGMPEPQLPPYDATRVRPIPYEAEVLALIAELEAKRREPSQMGEAEATPQITPPAPTPVAEKAAKLKGEDINNIF